MIMSIDSNDMKEGAITVIVYVREGITVIVLVIFLIS